MPSTQSQEPNQHPAGFSVVKLATDKETGQQWACKIMSLPPPGKQARVCHPGWTGLRCCRAARMAYSCSGYQASL